MALEGATLKGWKIGKKLGSGACSDVYAVDSVAPLTDKNCDAFVMKLSPLVAIDAAKAKNKKRKKSAAERNADALYAEHLMYQSHLREHAGLPYIPPAAYGEDKGYRFLVMERLGRTLEAVLQEHGSIPSATAAQLGMSLLDTLQYIHAKNIVYVDVKPENFMLDREKEKRVYFVDFGVADRYVMATGKHKEYKVGTVVGTPTFLSLNCHEGATASRRDDVEALLNVLIYLVRGDLPWQNASSDAEGAKIKRETSIPELCKGMPTEWATMMTKAREQDFEEKPDYEFFTKQLVKLGAKAGNNEPFAWGSQKAKPQPKAGASPMRKKSKSEDATPPVPAKADASKSSKKDPSFSADKADGKKTKPSAKQTTPKTVSRSSPKQPAKVAAAKKANGKDEEEQASDDDSSDDDVEFVKTGGKDPRRRRKAAAKAVAAAAAAEAAAKQAEGTGRYSLRSSSTRQPSR